MTDRQLIEIGARELIARQGFAAAAEMRQRDLEYLRERIEESSGILISLSTIKRILNGQYNRLPQVATLNALSVYRGYADWPAFKAAKIRNAGKGEVAIKRPLPWRRFRIGAGVVLLVLLVILSWSYLSRSPRKGGGEVSFTVRKTTLNSIPNTVVFTYDIDRLRGDSFFIQQSWDRNRRRSEEHTSELQSPV